MFNCFKKEKDRGPEIHYPKPEPLPRFNGEIEAVIIFVGHQIEEYGRDYGMRTYNKIKENHHNREWVGELLAKFKYKYPSAKVHLGRLRKEESDHYSKYCSKSKKFVKKLISDNGYNSKKVLCLEMHYNGASVPEARGAYNMVSDHRSALLSYPNIKRWTHEHNINLRKTYKYRDKVTGNKIYLKGVGFKSSGRGTKWIKSMTSFFTSTTALSSTFSSSLKFPGQ